MGPYLKFPYMNLSVQERRIEGGTVRPAATPGHVQIRHTPWHP